ncbi:hypothetical protein [Nocardioides limicola]|uniref:hypothetical protein n=1 Tax=Nocardioides limicola TaxID=2803368 RepID=UPI00193BFB24|nr:hypothetical protein [Nocardioides sp. DJM-14]
MHEGATRERLISIEYQTIEVVCGLCPSLRALDHVRFEHEEFEVAGCGGDGRIHCCRGRADVTVGQHFLDLGDDVGEIGRCAVARLIAGAAVLPAGPFHD